MPFVGQANRQFDDHHLVAFVLGTLEASKSGAHLASIIPSLVIKALQ
jgi:hypothetical protein